MNALAPSTIVVAMEQLDSEVAVLVERRHLLQQLLATFDDTNGLTTDEPTEWVRVEREPDAVPANEQFAIVDAAPAKKAVSQPVKGGSKGRKWDFAEVAQVIADGVEAGKSASGSLIESYGVNAGVAGYLMKRCRELGYTRDERVSFVPTPIERTSFDAQAARDAAAGPATGPVQGLGFAVKPTGSAQRPPTIERFSHHDAVAALEAS